MRIMNNRLSTVGTSCSTSCNFFEHKFCLGDDFVKRQFVGDIRKRSADIIRDKIEQVADGRCKKHDPETAVKKNGPDICRVDQVLKIIAGEVYFFNFYFQLLVNCPQLFIHTL